MPTVLVVDDNAIDRRLVARVLERAGWAACFAAHGQEALEVIERTPPDIVLTDLIMPVMGGLELLMRIRSDYPSIPVILMTAHGSEEIAVKAMRLGASSYLPKQSLVHDLGPTVREVWTMRRNRFAVIRTATCVMRNFKTGASG